MPWTTPSPSLKPPLLLSKAAPPAIPKAASLGDTTQPLQTSAAPPASALAPARSHPRGARCRTGRSQPYLETEAEVDAYLSRLKAELLAVVRTGQKARVQ